MIGNKKGEEVRVSTVLLHVISTSLTPSENRWTPILNRKRPKFVTGFETNLHRQNAIALPLVPPPQQLILVTYPFYCSPIISFS